MLFILIGLSFFLIIAILITLFSIDTRLGIIGVLALVVVLILLGRKIMGVQSRSQQKAAADLKWNLIKSFGKTEGRRVEEVLHVKSKNKSHREQHILYLNEMYKISEENGKEAVLELLQKLS